MIGSIDKVVQELSQKIIEHDSCSLNFNLNQIEVYSWPQTWPSGSCGFDHGGVSTMAFRKAQTVVVVWNDSLVAVAHDFKYAYILDLTVESDYLGFAVLNAIGEQEFPGQTTLQDWKTHAYDVFNDYTEFSAT